MAFNLFDTMSCLLSSSPWYKAVWDRFSSTHSDLGVYPPRNIHHIIYPVDKCHNSGYAKKNVCNFWKYDAHRRNGMDKIVMGFMLELLTRRENLSYWSRGFDPLPIIFKGCGVDTRFKLLQSLIVLGVHNEVVLSPYILAEMFGTMIMTVYGIRI